MEPTCNKRYALLNSTGCTDIIVPLCVLFNVMIIWIFIEGMFIFGPSFVIHRATIRQAIKRKKVRKLFSLFIINE
ncbi:hypothetical protein CWM58_10070 [Klebsiella sp. H-Nf2]|nr:hypothetical protein CWM58_10070 [Klebsiella sp. H-Nf2]